MHSKFAFKLALRKLDNKSGWLPTKRASPINQAVLSKISPMDRRRGEILHKRQSSPRP
jgi:hypothetical protein